MAVPLTPVEQLVKIVVKTPAPVPESSRVPTSAPKNLPPPAALSSVNAIPVGGGSQPNIFQEPSNGYSNPTPYAASQAPMMYTPEQQQQFQNNRPSIVLQIPEVPVAPDLRYFTTNPRVQPTMPSQTVRPPGIEHMYDKFQTTQAPCPPRAQRPAGPSYASLAAQNQDFSMDVDAIGGNSAANTQVTRQHFRPAGTNNQSMFQGQYDWRW